MDSLVEGNFVDGRVVDRVEEGTNVECTNGEGCRRSRIEMYVAGE